MKMNIKGLVFVGFAAAVFASAAKADIPTGDNAKKTVTSVNFTEATYQKKLTPGNFVAIDNSGNITTTYSEGTGINISNTGVISVDTEDLTNYAAGTNVTFTPGAVGTENEGKTVISATDTTYNAFNGSADGLVPSEGAAAGKVLSGNGNWIEVDGTAYEAGAHVADITNHTINVEGDGTITSGNNKLVTGGTVYTAVETRVPKQIGTASDEGKVLTVNNQGQVTLSAADEYQKKLTAGNFVAIDPSTNTITTTYSEGTNVQISNAGVISATDTTYSAGAHVSIDANDGNKISVADNGTVTSGDTNLVTGGTVYDAINGKTIPEATGCSTSNPCALVATGVSTFAWEPIQQ